jgi:hypothetical protein
MACTMSAFFLPQIPASALLIWAKALALLARRATARTSKVMRERMAEGYSSLFD